MNSLTERLERDPRLARAVLDLERQQRTFA